MERMSKDQSELIEEFLEDCKLRGIGSDSIIRYKSTVLIFYNFLEKHNRNFLNVDKEILKAFVGHLRLDKKLKHKTLENYFSALSTFYEYLVYEGLVPNNLILPIRKRYLYAYKKEAEDNGRRQCPSIEEIAGFINAVPNIRDKAIMILLAKTGIRRGELLRVEIDDINWKNLSITLKPVPKRSNRIVFFDDECAKILKAWLNMREKLVSSDCKALLINNDGLPLNRNGLYNIVVKWATRYGLHDPKSQKLEERFSPHCLRHWFTTQLLRKGMDREFVKELRGDARKDAIDIYNHIDLEELRKAYLVCIPALGV